MEFDIAENQISYYPHKDIPNFIQRISSKKEFRNSVIKYPKSINNDEVLSTSNKLCNKENVILLPQQEFLKNFISPDTPYNGILIKHGTGAGKTCAGISIIENSMNIIQKYNKKAYLILPARVEDNFKREIFNIDKHIKNPHKNVQCTGDIYSSMMLPDMDRKAIQSVAKKMIKNKYKILHYGTFSSFVENDVKKPGNNLYGEGGYKRAINKIFSNSVLLIDEVHNIRESNIHGENGDKKIRQILKEVITYSQNLKLIFMSATPMYNSAHEIVFLLNLLILNDIPYELRTNQQILNEKLISESKVFKEVGSEHRLTEEGMHIISEKSRGYVSYLRGENPYTFPTKIIPADAIIIERHHDPKMRRIEAMKHLKVIECPMHEVQYNLYKRDSTEDEFTSFKEDDDPMSSKALQNANITYPDSKLNIKSVMKIIRVVSSGDKKTKNPAKYVYKEPSVEGFFSLSNIRKYSSKMRRMGDYLLNSKGISFIYSFFITSGLTPIQLMLEEMGFNQYNPSGRNTNLLSQQSPNICYILPDGSIKSLHRSQPKPENAVRATYVLLKGEDDTSTMTTTQSFQAIQEGNKPENKDGRIIKVILGSRVAGEGLDFKNIRNIHILEPWHNLSRIDQAVGRAIRNCSHIDLPLKERTVNVYLYVASNPTIMKERRIETIDEYMYRKAENKDITIKRIDNILHRNAVDCMLNKRGNILTDRQISEYFPEGLVKGYQDGSRECMYDRCEYTCNTDESELPENKDTYNMSFVSRGIQIAKLEIKQLFSKGLVFSFDAISDSIGGDKDILFFSLNQMVENKEKVFDKFNRPGKIIHRSDIAGAGADKDANEYKPKILKQIEEGKLSPDIQIDRESFDEEGMIKLYDTKWKGTKQYYIFQPDELDDDQLDIRWRGVPLGWNPGKIELPNIEYADKVKQVQSESTKPLIKDTRVSVKKIKPSADTFLTEIEKKVLNLQKVYFGLTNSDDYRAHHSYILCVGNVLDTNYTLVSSEVKIGQADILEKLLINKFNNEPFTPIMSSILEYLRIYCFGTINDFVGGAKKPSSERGLGHLMYGSVLLHSAKPKNPPGWVLKGGTDYLVYRTLTEYGWKTSQLSLADSLSTINICNLSNYFGFISCIDGRTKKFDSNLIGTDTSFKFKKNTDTGNAGRACSTKPDNELTEIIKYLNINIKGLKGKGNKCLAIELKLREFDSIKYKGKKWFFRWSELNLKC